MNKKELIEQVAIRANLTKADAGRALNAVLDTIVEAVSNGDDVTLSGFGSFKATRSDPAAIFESAVDKK
jgi:DNA-binding protein HU-beta